MAFPVLQIAGLLYGAYRYFTKPKQKKASYKGGSIEVSATTNTPVPVVYGNCEVTGNIIYKEDTTSATNHLAVGLCEGEINAIESVRINGVNIPVYPETYEGCSYTPYYGTAAQTADARFTTSTMLITCAENNYVDEGDADTVQDWFSTSRLYIEHDKGDDKSKYLFLKFDISKLNITNATNDISNAYLRLYKTSVSLTANHTVYVYEMADDSWSEATIKWSNKPGFGDQITTVAGSLFNGAGQDYYDIDIKQWVIDTYDNDASKIVGIGMKVVNNASGVAQAVFAARDSAGAPVLRIGYAPKELASFAHTAYVALTVVDSALFKGHINDIKVSVQGKLIYDGDVSLNYSRTPAWIIYDLLTNARYGADIPTALINATSFSSVASYNDASVTTEDGVAEPRHRCDVVFDDKDTIGDRINDVLASFGGYLYMLDGKLNLGVDAAGSSSHSFTEDNIAAGSFQYWVIDKSQQPNDVSVMYYDAANDFKASYVNVKDQTLIDTYGRNFEEIQLRCINRYSQASRMAKYYLNKSSYSQYGCSFRASINNCDVAPGDICEITHAVAGWTAETFRIVSVQEYDNDELEVTCEEYDAALYSDDGLPYTPPEGGTLPNVNEIPPVITNLALTETYSLGDDGTYIPQISVTWTAPDYVFPLNFIVWWKLHSAATYKFWEMSTDAAAVISVPAADEYNVRIQTVNILTGLKTDFGTSPGDSITLAGKTAPPSDVSFNDINSTFYNKVYVEWLPITDNDLAYYELRTDTNWGNPTNRVWTGIATSYILENPAATAYTFHIKAKDLTGNYSNAADSITLTKSAPVLGTVTVEFSGKDCYVDWDHAYDEDFERYKIDVYSDAARTIKVHTAYISSPPYVYSYETNKVTNSGTPIRHPYFTITAIGSLSQTGYQNADDDNAAPTAPTGLTVTAGMGKLFISWTAIAANDILSYNIYAKTTSPANTLVGNVAGTNFTFDPEGENTYYVTVAGVDWFGEGTKCSEETQTTNPYALTNYKLDVPLTRDINFSVASSKAKWTTGTLYYEGSAYTIAAETTGTTDAFIYWDKDDPLKFNSSATAPALDDDIWVMAYFDGTDVYGAFAQKIIHGGLIQADSIEATKLSVSELSAISADLGTITAGTVTGATIQTSALAATGVKIDSDGITAYGSGVANFDLDSTTGLLIAKNVEFKTDNAAVPPITVTAKTEPPTAEEAAILIQDPDGVPVTTIGDQGSATFGGTVTVLDDIKVADKLIFDRTNDITVTVAAATAPLTYTMPDVDTNADFVMNAGAQTIAGVKTFSAFPVGPSSAPVSAYEFANKKYVDDNAGGSHAVLSATHTDTTAASVTRGDIITGQGAAPNTKWTRLAVGTNGYYLKSDGTDVSWAAVTATPAGSDSHVQYNNGGSLGGDAALTFDDSGGRLTYKCGKANSAIAFDTSSTDGKQDSLIVKNSAASTGEGELGASIGFCRNNSDVRTAAIVAKQTGSDGDQMGLSIYTHPSATGSAAIVEAIEINHDGHITLKNGATVFKIIDCPTLSMKEPASNPAVVETVKANGSGSTGVYGMKFNYSLSTTYSLYGSIRLPQDYKAGASLYPHINRIMTDTSANTTDVVRIGLEYTWCEEDGTMSNTSTPEKEIAVGADSTTKLIRSELDAISGSGKNPGSTMLFRLYREPVVTGTASEENMVITSLGFEYESDKLGSNATTV